MSDSRSATASETSTGRRPLPEHTAAPSPLPQGHHRVDAGSAARGQVAREQGGSTEHTAIPAEPGTPEGIAEDDPPVGAPGLVAALESAPEGRAHPQHGAHI